LALNLLETKKYLVDAPCTLSFEIVAVTLRVIILLLGKTFWVLENSNVLPKLLEV
jgi:hypothetical protein